MNGLAADFVGQDAALDPTVITYEVILVLERPWFLVSMGPGVRPQLLFVIAHLLALIRFRRSRRRPREPRR